MYPICRFKLEMKGICVFVILLTEVIFTNVQLAEATTELCVVPTDQSPCSCSETCHTFDYYLSNPDLYFISDVIFKFLPGTHEVNKAYSGSDVTNMSFTGTNDAMLVITSGNEVGTWFILHDSGSVIFSGLSFMSSTQNILFFMFANVSSIELTDVIMNNTCGGIAKIMDMNGRVMLYNVALQVFCTSPSVADFTPALQFSDVFGQIAFYDSNFYGDPSSVGQYASNGIQYYTSHIPPQLGNVTIKIHNSEFHEGCNSISINSILNGDLTLSARNVSFTNGSLQININTISTLSSANIFLENILLSHGYMDGVRMDFSTLAYVNINIINCGILNHFGRALSIFLGNNPNSTVVIWDSILKWNHGNISMPGIAMQISHSGTCSYLASVLMKNVTFESNHFSSGSSDGAVTALLKNIDSATIIDCTFKNNTGTALFLESSSVTVLGNVSFIDNVAYNGAALSIGGHSTINVSKETAILFANNTARHTGGAIYISTTTYDNVQFTLDQSYHSWCFIKYDDNQLNSVLIFDNNTASEGGYGIFGGSLDEIRYNGLDRVNCSNNTVQKKCIDVVKTLSKFDQKTSSQISSSPSRVCLCENNTAKCLQYKKTIQIYPGETLTISAYTVGQQFGISSGSVYAQILNKSSHVSLQRIDQVQRVGIHVCNDRRNTLFYKLTRGKVEKKATLVLTAEDVVVSEYVDDAQITAEIDMYEGNLTCNITAVPQQLLTLPVYISLIFLECPLGFVLREDSSYCVCADIFNNHPGRQKVSCDIDTQTIQRQSSVWVDADNTTARYSQYCPLLYCNTSVLNVSLNKENGADEQCMHHHSGILCGGCQTNYSLAIGSSNCLPNCSDKYLSLLLVFAVAGVLLVLFIKFLNLTITQGMVNGLIFYANIVQSNKDTLLSSSEPAVRVFAAFIAWLNLDFGIETCFSRSLNMSLKTWLQFVFPIYLWMISGGIVLACRYSRLATRFFGNNAVQVLATIFLLSYNKILRIIITVCSVTIIETQTSENVGEELVWSYDGNIQFLGIRHGFLFGACIGVFLFHWLPFTLYVLLGQWLQRYNHYWGLRWIGKLRPLLDAYYGPLKDHCHYWVGILLLARVVVILPAAIPHTSNSASLLTIICLGLALLFILACIGKVYRKYYLSILETSSIINLVFFATMSQYYYSVGGRNDIAVYISVGFSLIVFLTIVTFQLYSIIKEKVIGRWCRPGHNDYDYIGAEGTDLPDLRSGNY